MLLKQVAAILLLAILSFNLLGYHLFFNYLQAKQQHQLQEKLYSVTNYTDEDLRSVKVPVTFPYYNNDKTFEPASGEIEISGTYYKVVKKRIYNDSLEIVYMVDVEKGRLQTAKSDFVKQVNGIETSKEGSKSLKPVKPLTFEFTVNNFFQVSTLVSSVNPPFCFNETATVLSNNFFAIDHPPKVLLHNLFPVLIHVV